MSQLDRRDFLKLGVAFGAVAAVGALPVRAQAAPTRAGLEEICAMTPVQMAEASGPVMDAWDSLQWDADEIRNPALRNKVQGVLDNPAPTFAAGIGQVERKALHKELAAKGLLEKTSVDELLPPDIAIGQSPQPFYSAPGSGYGSHHAYPGGLATHTSLNMRVAKALADGYQEVYGYQVERDTVIASQLLHDLLKPWVFQWNGDGSARTERTLAGTGEHHVLSLAESIHRGMPAEVVVAQACAHNHPRTPEDEAQVVGWLTAAAVLAGVDPVRAELLAKDGKTLPLPRRQEGFICHLGDHDWVLTVPAAQWTIPALKAIAVRDYGVKENDARTFNQFRNYVFSQASIMALYETYAARGEQELTRTVRTIVTPA